MFEIFLLWFASTFIFAFIVSIFVFFNINTDFNSTKQFLVHMFNPKINTFNLNSIIMWGFRGFFFGSILIIIYIVDLFSIPSNRPYTKSDKPTKSTKGRIGISDKLVDISSFPTKNE